MIFNGIIIIELLVIVKVLIKDCFSKLIIGGEKLRFGIESYNLKFWGKKIKIKWRYGRVNWCNWRGRE